MFLESCLTFTAIKAKVSRPSILKLHTETSRDSRLIVCLSATVSASVQNDCERFDANIWSIRALCRIGTSRAMSAGDFSQENVVSSQRRVRRM